MEEVKKVRAMWASKDFDTKRKIMDYVMWDIVSDATGDEVTVYHESASPKNLALVEYMVLLDGLATADDLIMPGPRSDHKERGGEVPLLTHQDVLIAALAVQQQIKRDKLPAEAYKGSGALRNSAGLTFLGGELQRLLSTQSAVEKGYFIERVAGEMQRIEEMRGLGRALTTTKKMLLDISRERAQEIATWIELAKAEKAFETGRKYQHLGEYYESHDREKMSAVQTEKAMG